MDRLSQGNPPPTTPPGTRAVRRIGRALALLALAWLLAVSATWIYVQQRIEASHARSLERGRRDTGDLAALLHAQVTGELAAADDLLRVLVNGALAGPQIARMLLAQPNADGEPYARVSYADSRGVVLASSARAQVGASLAHRPEFLRARREEPGAASFVGEPSRDARGLPGAIPLVRRVSSADGTFQGVVEVLIGSAHLVRRFDTVPLGARGLVALVDRNGIVHARAARRGTSDAADDAALISRAIERAASAARGSFVHVDASAGGNGAAPAGGAQGAARVVSYWRVERDDLVALVAKSDDEFLEQHTRFRRDGVTTGAVITVLVSLVALLASIYLRHEQRSAEALARALALEHANARTDVLTGLPNRRAFLDLLAAQIQFHRRRSAPLSVAFFDCDRFKQVNDRLGHEAGDRCLVRVASLLSDGLRRSDYPCRIGGDEFAALFPATRSEDAALVMERLRARLARELAAQGFAVTVSVGVIEVGEDDVSPETVLTQADATMYQAKRAGGNRVVAMPSARTRAAGPRGSG